MAGSATTTMPSARRKRNQVQPNGSGRSEPSSAALAAAAAIRPRSAGALTGDAGPERALQMEILRLQMRIRRGDAEMHGLKENKHLMLQRELQVRDLEKQRSTLLKIAAETKAATDAQVQSLQENCKFYERRVQELEDEKQSSETLAVMAQNQRKKLRDQLEQRNKEYQEEVMKNEMRRKTDREHLEATRKQLTDLREKVLLPLQEEMTRLQSTCNTLQGESSKHADMLATASENADELQTYLHGCINRLEMTRSREKYLLSCVQSMAEGKRPQHLKDAAALSPRLVGEADEEEVDEELEVEPSVSEGHRKTMNLFSTVASVNMAKRKYLAFTKRVKKKLEEEPMSVDVIQSVITRASGRLAADVTTASNSTGSHALKQEHESLVESKAELEEDVLSLNGELKKCKGELVKIELENKRLLDEKEEQQREQQRQQAELAKRLEIINGHDDQMKWVKEQLEQAEQEAKKLKAAKRKQADELQGVQAQHARLKEQDDHLASEFKAEVEKREKLQARLGELELQLQANAEEAVKLTEHARSATQEATAAFHALVEGHANRFNLLKVTPEQATRVAESSVEAILAEAVESPVVHRVHAAQAQTERLRVLQTVCGVLFARLSSPLVPERLTTCYRSWLSNDDPPSDWAPRNHEPEMLRALHAWCLDQVQGDAACADQAERNSRQAERCPEANDLVGLLRQRLEKNAQGSTVASAEWEAAHLTLPGSLS